jgi:hypothetical protein
MTAVSHAMWSEPDDDPPALGPAVDRFDMEIVEFMVSWAPYGGPPKEECMPLFGMSSDRLEARFRAIVDIGQRRHLSEPELALLERAATLLGRQLGRCGRVAGPTGSHRRSADGC